MMLESSTKVRVKYQRDGHDPEYAAFEAGPEWGELTYEQRMQDMTVLVRSKIEDGETARVLEFIMT